MGWRFYKRISIFPGLRLNLSRSGVSASIGHRGAWYTVGARGRRVTIGLPGSGIFYTRTQPWRRWRTTRYNVDGSVVVSHEEDEPRAGHRALFILLLAVLAWVVVGYLRN